MFWCKFSAIAGGPVLIGFLLMLGRQRDLFQTTGWYDVMMHLLGGIFLTVTLAGTAWHAGLKTRPRLLRRAKPLLLAGILFTAIGWEIFEVRVGLVPNWTHSAGDTAADVLCALAGSLAVLRFIRNG